MAEHGPLVLPVAAWRRPDTARVLQRRDVPALLTLAQQFSGASQARLAAAVGLGQSRTNELLRGHRTVSSLDVLERIADGLSMPDAARMLLGLAPILAREATSVDELSGVISRSYTSQAAARREMQALVAGCTTVDVVAVRGLGLLGLNDSLLRTTVSAPRERPLVVRVALLDPDSPFAARRAAEIGESVETFSEGVRLSEMHLTDLARQDALDLSVYLYDSLPTWRVIALGDTLYVGTFDEHWEGHESPMYRLDPGTGGAMHRGMRRMCDGLFAGAVRTV